MSVARDVSISELMHLRDQRLSNREIAEKLDCSVATVYNLIGKQPPGIRAPRRTKEKPMEALPTTVTEHESFAQRLEKMRTSAEAVTPPEECTGCLAGCTSACFRTGGRQAVSRHAAVRAEGRTRQGNECRRLRTRAA